METTPFFTKPFIFFGSVLTEKGAFSYNWFVPMLPIHFNQDPTEIL